MPCWLAVIPHLFFFSRRFPEISRKANSWKIFSLQAKGWFRYISGFFRESDTASNYEITITPLTNLAQWHLYLKSIIQSLPLSLRGLFKSVSIQLDSVASSAYSFLFLFCNRKRFFYVLLHPPARQTLECLYICRARARPHMNCKKGEHIKIKPEETKNAKKNCWWLVGRQKCFKICARRSRR